MKREECNHQIFRTEWDIVINLGVKCNLLQHSREANVRYFSSPFDNMDSVDGLTQSADLICNKFIDYFNSSKPWRMRPHISKNTGEPTTLILFHKTYPSLYYPHFYEGWFPQKVSKQQIDSWIRSSNPDIEFGLSAIKHAFMPRQQRLIRILDSELKILFVRLDDIKSARRIFHSNKQTHFEYHYQRISEAFTRCSVGYLYLYSENPGQRRHYYSNDRLHFIKLEIGNDMVDSGQIVSILKKIRVKPRSLLQSLGIT